MYGPPGLSEATVQLFVNEELSGEGQGVNVGQSLTVSRGASDSVSDTFTSAAIVNDSDGPLILAFRMQAAALGASEEAAPFPNRRPMR